MSKPIVDGFIDWYHDKNKDVKKIRKHYNTISQHEVDEALNIYKTNDF